MSQYYVYNIVLYLFLLYYIDLLPDFGYKNKCLICKVAGKRLAS